MREKERDGEERPMPTLGITVSFYKLNNYLGDLIFQIDDYSVPTTYCMSIK